MSESVCFFFFGQTLWWLPPLALALDLLFADPRAWPHPVRAIGFLADRLEKPARRNGHPLAAGMFVLLLLLAVTGVTVCFFVSLPFGLGSACALYFAWSGLALGGLIREGKHGLACIERARNDESALPEARKAVQMLVSRDTGRMDCDDLCRSLCESVSENLNDAFVAPFFWLLLTGPVGLWLYKCVSTMDSMWGYTSERWLLLGRASARLDDLLAYIPARLTAALMLTGAWMVHMAGCGKDSSERGNSLPDEGRIGGSTLPGKGLRNKGVFRAFTVPGWPGWAVVAGQAGLSASPNAGWPMAAAAWLFDGRTGGPTVYDGKIVHKPEMGPENGRWTDAGASALLRQTPLMGILACVLGTGMYWAVLFAAG